MATPVSRYLYFQVLRIPVTRGRSFDFRDRNGAKSSLVVNETFVEKYLPERDPIGARIAISGETREIVGVVGSVIQKSSGWGRYGPVDHIPTAYIPARQGSDGFFKLVHTWFAPTWVVRTSRSAATVIDGMQRSVTSVKRQAREGGSHRRVRLPFLRWTREHSRFGSLPLPRRSSLAHGW